jgi:hypothetical protein
MLIEKLLDEVKAARKLGNKHNPDSAGRFPWDTKVTLSRASLGRLAFFVHMHGGNLGSTFTLGTPLSFAAARSYSVWVRMFLRPEKVGSVERDAKVKIEPAAKPNLGLK